MTDSATLDEILQGLHIAVMDDVGLELTNADAKQLLDEITKLAASNMQLRRENERLSASLESAKMWIPQWAQEDDPTEDDAWKNL